jgi:hypothetical protein
MTVFKPACGEGVYVAVPAALGCTVTVSVLVTVGAVVGELLPQAASSSTAAAGTRPLMRRDRRFSDGPPQKN